MSRAVRVLLLVVALAAAATLVGGARAAGPWCGGTEEVASDRQPDAVSGSQVHVVYALPADQPDRFAAVAPQLVDDLAAADAWWRGQDPTRTPRFDRFAFAGCASAAGALDISFVRLPHESSYYDVASDAQAALLRLDLAPVRSNPFKKYLLFYDGPARATADVCGHSPSSPESGGLAATAIVLLQQGAACGLLGSADYLDVTAVHELVHDLGAVLPDAPHACPEDPGHVCDSDADLMKGGGGSFPDLASYRLDDGRDDYYGHPGAWWDVQDSPWLVRLDAPQFPLTVGFGGAGGGTVASDLPGQACSASCAVEWQAGTTVELSAAPEPGVDFVGWTGACTGADTTCEVTVDAAKEVVARFDRTFDLSATILARGGSGTLAFSTGERCSSGTCAVTEPQGTVVDLSAAPAAGSRFVGWAGACLGTGRCTVLLDGTRSVSAVFGPARAPLSVRVHGKGTVASAPAGLACPSSCAGAFRFGSSVRLAARPARGWRFAGWSGGCSGRGRCAVAAGKAHLVSALFTRIVR